VLSTTQQKERWELHLVCKDEIETPNAPGNETAGVDLGINNFAAVAYSTEDADLYPGNRLKQDGYYFPRRSPSATTAVVTGQLGSITSGRNAALTSSSIPWRNTSSNGVSRRK